MSRPSFDAYRDLPADETRGNPLHAWGMLHADKLGTYWTIPVDVPLREFASLKPVVQSKARLASVVTALRAGKPLPPVELGVYRDGSAWIVDGNHRLIAARKERLATVPVTFTFVTPPVAGSRKKTTAQLDAEIAHALARSSEKIGVHDLDVLAQAASFGNVSVEDLAPSARTVARMSPSYIKRARAARRRIDGLVARQLLTEIYGDRYVMTEAGRAALSAAGYAPNRAGSWLKPSARVPGWAL